MQVMEESRRGAMRRDHKRYPQDAEWQVNRLTELLLTGWGWTAACNLMGLSRGEFSAVHDAAVRKVQAERQRIEAEWEAELE
jgi:hypothetical protein